MERRKKAFDVFWRTRVDDVEIKSRDGRSVEDSGDPSYDDEIHSVLCQRFQKCQEIR